LLRALVRLLESPLAFLVDSVTGVLDDHFQLLLSDSFRPLPSRRLAFAGFVGRKHGLR
jgi:hypothetical protein